MNSETIIFLEKICRTCMNAGESNDNEFEGEKLKGVSIFNKPEGMECKNITIMELLMTTTPQLNIESDDMLPKILCESCLDRLISAYEFQKMCIRVEQTLRQMLKEECSVESLSNRDPLKDNLIDISIENVAVSQTINDLSNILKIEIDEPLIDQDESTLSSKIVADDTESVKFETGENQWENVSDSDVSAEVESDSDWERPCIKSKNGSKVVKKVNEEMSFCIHEDLKDNIPDEEEQISIITDESEINSNLPTNKKFSCEACGNRLATRKSLIRHKRIHLRSVGNDFKDEQTSEVIEESKIGDDLSSNIKDGENKKFVCDECGSRLATRKSLKRHKRIHLRPVDKEMRNTFLKTKHECEFCKKIFQQSSSLKDHLRTHTGEQPYLCSECGKAFKSLSNMKQHFMRHGTDRPYVCPDCPKRFPCLSDLASHKAVHNKTKSHVCDICGAAFVKPYLLKKHKMYHTGEKNHKCDYCEMRFVLADQCRRHMRTHTGEKPYKCKYCERAFAQSNDLVKHLRGHLGDNVYKCDLCPQGFRLQMDLRAHFNTHKNDDEETRERNLQALKDEEHRLQMKLGLANCT